MRIVFLDSDSRDPGLSALRSFQTWIEIGSRYASWRWFACILASKLWSCIFINFKMMCAASMLVFLDSESRDPGLSALGSFQTWIEIGSSYASWRWFACILASKLWSCIFINFKMMCAASMLVSWTQSLSTQDCPIWEVLLHCNKKKLFYQYASWRWFPGILASKLWSCINFHKF